MEIGGFSNYKSGNKSYGNRFFRSVTNGTCEYQYEYINFTITLFNYYYNLFYNQFFHLIAYIERCYHL